MKDKRRGSENRIKLYTNKQVKSQNDWEEFDIIDILH